MDWTVWALPVNPDETRRIVSWMRRDESCPATCQAAEGPWRPVGVVGDQHYGCIPSTLWTHPINIMDASQNSVLHDWLSQMQLYYSPCFTTLRTHRRIPLCMRTHKHCPIVCAVPTMPMPQACQHTALIPLAARPHKDTVAFHP